MAQLAVNVDHVATLREARKIDYPEPAAAAVLAETAGADGIVVHLREDRRHINERDVNLIKKLVKSKLILEMAATSEMLGIALNVRPDIVTLVPESRQEVTTEGGLDIITHQNNIRETVATLKNAGIQVSIFVDPDLDQIKTAHRVDADMIEIHTGAFCDATTEKEKEKAFTRIVNAAKTAHKLKLGVNAGHGLCYHTIKAFKGLAEVDEFSIGHSIISRAVFTGLEQAVRDMRALIKEL